MKRLTSVEGYSGYNKSDTMSHNRQLSHNCPTCAAPMTYVGIDDGAGEWGTAICDCWHCESCNVYIDGDCIGDLGYMPDEWDAFESADELE